MNERWQQHRRSTSVRKSEPVYEYAYEYVYGGTTERGPNKPVEPRAVACVDKLRATRAWRHQGLCR